MLRIQELTPDLWPAFEKLFGSNGACGGCWCMYWRLEKGESWDLLKGPAAKRQMKRLIADGKAHGALAFIDDEPVGWASFGPRGDYPRLNRARTLACDDVEAVWSVPCFYIQREHRGTGVATALLRFTLAALKQRRVLIAEGYPVKPTLDGAPSPAAFAWTGTRALFEKCGFEPVGHAQTAKQRFRHWPQR